MNTRRFSMKMITSALASAFAMGFMILTDAPVVAGNMPGTTAYHQDVVGHSSGRLLALAGSLTETRSNQEPQGASWNRSAGSGHDNSRSIIDEKESARPRGYDWVENYFKGGEARTPFIRK